MLPSTVFTLASGSKLLTTIAVLQLVERGQLSLDSDMTPYLPQPTPSPSSPSSAAPAIPTTLRHLLTHTSGLAYPFLNPRVAALKAAALGTPDPFAGATLHERYGYPPAASSQPGTQFQMGPSIDFAGSALERVTGTDLDSYFVEHLLAPLGIAPGAGQMTFFPQRVVAGGLVDGGPGGSFAGVAVRDEETGRLRAAGDEKVGKAYLASEEAFGGEGAYASAPAYAAVLESLLRDDGRLLRPATAAAMFEPQLPGAEARRSLNELLVRPDWVVGPVPPGEYDWGLGGLLWLGGKGDRGGHRRRGMMGWGGMFNMTWVRDDIHKERRRKLT